MREIGSEFSLININEKEDNLVDNLNFLNYGFDRRYLFSGRTAIDFVIKDILITRKDIELVYLPNYCCYSMIEPFLKNGLKIKFYKVEFYNQKLNVHLPYNLDNTIFLAMSYFGFDSLTMDDKISRIKKNSNAIVIEDNTHRFLSDINFSNSADYVITSLRKWFPILSGGYAVKNNSSFVYNLKLRDSNNLVNKKLQSMALKTKYLIDKDDKIDKNYMLKSFKEANKIFATHVEGYKLDSYSEEILKRISFNKIKKIRIENANILIKNIPNNILLGQLGNGTPLFVPVNIKQPEQLQIYLRQRNIYSPIHWPLPKSLNESSDNYNDIYKTELSLICDQRYCEIDMMAITKALNDYLLITDEGESI
ncbi:hypothetical protein [Nosocomiicoccus ampullae]|uniref:hypothetical protein n=1 Tax=Nosocomiicoccus ampullae TaxID=489910 RepID=UPI00254F0490|nr:hypothetical protein [Nosocomiicoccus ampullae]MDK6864082.1 hypothetical protein [Nosocomiicoccus ampullae]